MRYGELPDDLDYQTQSLGPPPIWFKTISAYPVRWWGMLQAEQREKMNRQSDLYAASKYTTIDPASPLYGRKQHRYGYGDYLQPSNILCFAIISVAFLYYFKK